MGSVTKNCFSLCTLSNRKVRLRIFAKNTVTVTRVQTKVINKLQVPITYTKSGFNSSLEQILKEEDGKLVNNEQKMSIRYICSICLMHSSVMWIVSTSLILSSGTEFHFSMHCTNTEAILIKSHVPSSY